jgi:hypothetical protein
LQITFGAWKKLFLSYPNWVSKSNWKKRKAHKKSQSKPTTLTKPAITSRQSSLKTGLSLIKFGKRFWGAFVALGVILGVLSVLHSYGARISVFPYSTLVPNDPFATPFIISNDGLLPVYNVQVTENLIYVEDAHGMRATNVQMGGIGNLGSLSSGRKTAISHYRYLPFATPFKSASIAEIVSYRAFLSFKRSDVTYKFIMVRNVSGECLWIPTEK